MQKHILIFFYILQITTHLKISTNPSIVPFLYAKHAPTLAKCAQQSFKDIFSGSPKNPCYNNAQKQFAYGMAQPQHLAQFSNEKGEIYNHDGSITVTNVLELNADPIGYIKYTTPHLYPQTATIDQLAILQNPAHKGLGRLLLLTTCKKIAQNNDIFYVAVTTTNKEVGEKFYNKLGFNLINTSKSMLYPDETLYVWATKIK